MKNFQHVVHQLSTVALIKRVKSISGSVQLTLLVTLLIGFVVTACKDHLVPQPGQVIQDNGLKPDWGPTITPQMLAVINELGRLAPTPLNLLSPEDARKQPSFKDAVNSLLDKNNIPRPTANVTISEITIPGDGGFPLRAKIYTPKNISGLMPVIVYYHGGGWVIANSEVYEYSTLALAEETGAVVVSVNYRLAPEYKFKTAHLDAYAAYKWVTSNMSALRGNSKVAVAGESAGGNMAITVAMMARDDQAQLTKPLHILSVFPVADNDPTVQSYKDYANAKPLNPTLIKYFTDNYFTKPTDGDDPLISLVDVANLAMLPPVTIIAAEIDPLQTEGMKLRDKLINVAGNKDVMYQLYKGVTHEFFGMYAIVPEAQQAQILAATRLRTAFQ